MPPIPNKQVHLVMLNPNKFGGTVTYTAHLYHALKAAGAEPMIYEIGKRLSGPRGFGYGCPVMRCPSHIIAGLKGIIHITACVMTRANKNDEYERAVAELYDAGAFITIHDPNDLNNSFDREFISSRRIAIIRPNNTRICPNATFIPHPFVRHYKNFMFSATREKHAVTLSRLGAIKRTKWIVEANRFLPPSRQVWLRGYDDRFFTYNAFVRDGKYPEFRQDSDLPPGEQKTFKKELGEAQKIAVQAKYLVDLTEIKGDGGGTQYSFLEGIDAGCVLILNKAWTDVHCSMWKDGYNCLTVGSMEELVDTLNKTRSFGFLEGLASKAHSILTNHEPFKIGRRYLEFYRKNRDED